MQQRLQSSPHTLGLVGLLSGFWLIVTGSWFFQIVGAFLLLITMLWPILRLTPRSRSGLDTAGLGQAVDVTAKDISIALRSHHLPEEALPSDVYEQVATAMRELKQGTLVSFEDWKRRRQSSPPGDIFG